MRKSLLTVLTLLATCAYAQQEVATTTTKPTEGYTLCGALATGRDLTQRSRDFPQGKPVTGAFYRQFVGPDGAWHTCQPWVPDGGDPAMKEPVPDAKCPGKTTYEFWEVNGRLCTSIPPGTYDGPGLMLVETLVGRQRIIVSPPEWTRMGKATWGYVQFRCVANMDGSVSWQRTASLPNAPSAVCQWAND